MTREELLTHLDRIGLGSAGAGVLERDRQRFIDDYVERRAAILAAFDALAAERDAIKVVAKTNTILRKIASFVPAKIWIKAKEDAGYGDTIKVHLNDPAVDEAWVQFVGAGRSSPTAPRVPSAEVVSVPRELIVRAIDSIDDYVCDCDLAESDKVVLADLRKFIAEGT